MKTNGETVTQIQHGHGIQHQIEKVVYSKYENGSVLMVESSIEYGYWLRTPYRGYMLRKPNLNGKLLMKKKLDFSFRDFDCTSTGTIIVQSTDGKIFVFNVDGNEVGCLI